MRPVYKNSGRLTQLCRTLSPTDLSASATCSAVSTKTKKQQTCAKCAVHGVKNINKGHKNYCKWKECPCEKCVKVEERRRKMKEDIQGKRKLLNDIERKNQGLTTEEVLDPEALAKPKRKRSEYLDIYFCSHVLTFGPPIIFWIFFNSSQH
jgi:DM DNA binding domain